MESSDLVNLILEKLNNNEVFSGDDEECSSDDEEYIEESNKEDDCEHVDDTSFFVDEDTPSEPDINFSDIPPDGGQTLNTIAIYKLLLPSFFLYRNSINVPFCLLLFATGTRLSILDLCFGRNATTYPFYPSL